MNKKNKLNVLAIGSHPDDIEFGCGGTLLKLSNSGYNIALLIMTKGDIGGTSGIRWKEQTKSSKYLNAKNLFYGGFNDTKIMPVKETINKIEEIILQVNPNYIFVNYSDDTHQDHRAVGISTLSATRYIKNVLFYEVPTSQNFNPTVYIDITDFIDKKKKLLSIHKSQVFQTRIAGLSIIESAISTAYFRGYQGRYKFAEAFMPIRLSLL